MKDIEIDMFDMFDDSSLFVFSQQTLTEAIIEDFKITNIKGGVFIF